MALSFVQWGAGNIGRSFIGSVFNKSGYKVTFIDIDTLLIEALNKASSYVVKTIDGSTTKDIVVQGVSAINGNNQEEVNNAIIGASLIGVSVGKNVWPHIASSLATAIISRYKEKPREPLNIILAENIHHASTFVTSLITPHLPDNFPFTTYVGLVETSIGKMVPLQDIHQPLVLKSEVYNELIVDKNGFIGALPEVKDLHPVTPIEAYVDRKLFIHNLGHATTSYVGFSTHPNSPLIATVLEDKEVLTLVREAMVESSEVLLELHPTVFTKISLLEHIDDLLRRFQNLALGDTLYRVGRDLKRKLRYDDRLMGIIIEAIKVNKGWTHIGKAYLCALSFYATDEHNKMLESDELLLKSIEGLSLKEKLYKVSGWKESKLSSELFDTIYEKFEEIEKDSI